MKTGEFDTALVSKNLAALLAASAHQVTIAPPDSIDDASISEPTIDDLGEAEEGVALIPAPMAGTVVTVSVCPGDVVAAGESLTVLEAMKMEHLVRASTGGTVLAVAVKPGEMVAEGAKLFRIRIGEGDTSGRPKADTGGVADLGWASEIQEVERRRELARTMGGPSKLARQNAEGKLNVRERIDALVDPGSFSEIGALTAFVSYDEDGEIVSYAPANFVAGTGRVNGRKIVVGADDFTLRAGSGDAAFMASKSFPSIMRARCACPSCAS
jgi:biotin carboxyl carrier protein